VVRLLIWTAEEARAADRQAEAEGTAGAWLMEAAGAAVARAARQLGAGRVLVVAGPGQNGGDGWVAARRLARAGAAVRVAAPLGVRFAEGERWRAAALGAGATVVPAQTALEAARWADVVIDAGFGTGLARPLAPAFQAVLDAVREAGPPVVAVDLPSGVDTDDGGLRGDPVSATVTVTFGALKPAHVLHPAAAYAGRLVVADIGLPRRVGKAWRVDEPERLVALLGERPATAHKYRSGRLTVVAGSRAYAGAAGLCGLAAVRTGAGYVEVLTPEAAAVRLRWLPLIVRPQAVDGVGRLVLGPDGRDAVARAAAVVVGPGLGPTRPDVLDVARATGRPAVVDADALAAWAALGRPRWPSAVFTPHEGEAARVLGTDPGWVATHRREAARALAEMTGGVVVLKGPRTLVAAAGDPAVWVNWAGGPELATAGTGDVLAGMVGTLLAQGLAPADAARLAVWWHGAAGHLAARELGREAVGAQDVAERIGRARAELAAGWRPPDWPEEGF
jgi:hydroxyethylthiazole kinase-like uncharacterized protein yjeF